MGQIAAISKNVSYCGHGRASAPAAGENIFPIIFYIIDLIILSCH
jgi:hypothetical protein